MICKNLLNWTLSAILLGMVCVLPVQTAQADEPYLEFLQGLRSRQYFDTAMSYLETLEERPEVPQPIKEVIPYEKAVTLLQGAQFLQNPEAQGTQLDQAQAFLERFIKASPKHELVASANTELGRIKLGKAQVLIWRSRSPSNTENRAKFQQEARQEIQQARQIFQKAHDAYKQEWEDYGVYIPEEEKEKRAARAKVEGLYIRSQLDLASCTYEEAQTYDKGSDKFKEMLRKASLEFEELHTKYRSQYAGLYARTMQGKCFEEQDDIRKALGIYDELLSHNAQSEGLKRLQHQVLQFRLICLNHPTRKDYQLVIQEAGDWIRLNRSYARNPIGLGIRWELAQAQEALALDRTTAEADKLRLLRQALENAREINKYAGPYRDVSNSMIQRLLVALDREPGDPKDFDTAFGSANTMLEQIGELREKIRVAEKAGKKEEVTKLQEELQALLSETERLYRLALALVTPDVAMPQINAARYRLAYMFYLQRKSFETAVVGEFLSLRAKTSDPGMALDGAYLAMAGFSQAYNDAPESAKEDVLAMMVAICERIAKEWPDSDRATDARLEMGRIYRRDNKPLLAAKWFSEVPNTVPQYASSQLEAGQAYWNAYLNTLVDEESTASNEELKKWQDQAAEHLQKGITKLQEGIPAESETPAELVRAKVSLSQIEIMRGNEQKAVELLTADPHSVIKAISIAEGQSRPKDESNIKSSTFASFAYQQLLRAYIGTKQLDKAESTRAALEKAAGQSGGEALTAVYVELGRELQNELERLRKQGDQKRLEDVRNGFEAFLGQLFARKDGQTYGSLIWIAETYFGLAQGSEESPQKEKQYYTAASQTYEEIIKRGTSNPSFIDASRLIGVKLRLVNCKRQEGDYPAAETLIKEVLKASPKALDAQIEAANVYQSWGNEGGEIEHLLDAVRGKNFDDGTAIWGWGNIVKRLYMLIDAGQGTPEYIERNREARYRMAECRYLYAEKATDLTASEEQLQKAKMEIVTYTSTTPDLLETSWWPKFDKLYQNIQRNLGEAAVPLAKPDETALAATDSSSSNYDFGEANQMAEGRAAEAAAQKTAPPKPADNTMTFVLLGVFLVAGLGIGGYMVMGSGKGKKKRSTAELMAAMPKAPRTTAGKSSSASSKRPRPAAANPEPMASAPTMTASPTPGVSAEARPVRQRTREGQPEARPGQSSAKKSPEQRKPIAPRSDDPTAQKRVRRKPPEQS